MEKWLKSEYWRCVCVFCALEHVDAKWVLNLMSIFVMVISRWWDGVGWYGMGPNISVMKARWQAVSSTVAGKGHGNILFDIYLIFIETKENLCLYKNKS
jgi:hypothetical protein